MYLHPYLILSSLLPDFTSIITSPRAPTPFSFLPLLSEKQSYDRVPDITSLLHLACLPESCYSSILLRDYPHIHPSEKRARSHLSTMLSADDAWLLINDALKNMKSCQLLSVRQQRRVLHALGALNASPPEAAHLHQPCSPSRQKRQKFYGFLRTVLHTCGPYGVLVAAIGLTQTIVSGMTNYQRNALCEKLASHKDWQLPDSPHLQSFVVQLRALRSVYSMFLHLKF